jgi:hypothetical protein
MSLTAEQAAAILPNNKELIMKLRIDYDYARGLDAWQYNFEIHSDVAEIKNKSELNGFIRTAFSSWTGEGSVKILSVSDSFKNDQIDKLSEKISGQIIDFNNGVVTFRRTKKTV